jgi:hypothetical protein
MTAVIAFTKYHDRCYAHTNGGVTHFNLGSPEQGTNSASNQNYDTHIVGGKITDVGEYLFFGKSTQTEDLNDCL